MINESLDKLVARLPGLAWKLNTLYSVFPSHLLPPHLFKERVEMTPKTCIDEINTDLQVLAEQKNERSMQYLVEKIGQKINVLVQLCQKTTTNHYSKKTEPFAVHALSTRQQWLASLEEDVAQLSAQQQALSHTLEELKKTNQPKAILSLQAELGELERSLTLAKETLARAIHSM
jgi:hypothetical protein